MKKFDMENVAEMSIVVYTPSQESVLIESPTAAPCACGRRFVVRQHFKVDNKGRRKGLLGVTAQCPYNHCPFDNHENPLMGETGVELLGILDRKPYL